MAFRLRCTFGRSIVSCRDGRSWLSCVFMCMRVRKCGPVQKSWRLHCSTDTSPSHTLVLIVGCRVRLEQRPHHEARVADARGTMRVHVGNMTLIPLCVCINSPKIRSLLCHSATATSRSILVCNAPRAASMIAGIGRECVRLLCSVASGRCRCGSCVGGARQLFVLGDRRRVQSTTDDVERYYQSQSSARRTRCTAGLAHNRACIKLISRRARRTE